MDKLVSRESWGLRHAAPMASFCGKVAQTTEARGKTGYVCSHDEVVSVDEKEINVN